MIHSYSSIATFKQCPAKYNWSYREKVGVAELPPSPALQRGSDIHDSIDKFMRKESELLHPDIHSNYGQFMLSIRESSSDLRPEWEWGITWDFEPCGYSDPKAMLHGYMDLLVISEPDSNLGLYEWKTGKYYPTEHHAQVWKYSVGLMVHFPDHPGVDAMLTYLDQVDYKKIHYSRHMFGENKDILRREVNEIVDAKVFPMMPSFKCRWCKFSKDNGGPCKF